MGVDGQSITGGSTEGVAGPPDASPEAVEAQTVFSSADKGTVPDPAKWRNLSSLFAIDDVLQRACDA
jgi:hypothetical protein